MRTTLAFLALTACLAGCGSEVSSSGERQDAPPVVVEQHRPADIGTQIVGASKEQEELLREILGGVDPVHVAKTIIEPVEAGWEPFPESAVQITLRGPDSFQANWNRLLVAGAFMDRSHDAGLPTVAVWVNVDDGAQGVGRSDNKPSGRVQDPDEVAEQVGKAANEAGARVREIRLLRPWNDALAVSFEVDGPAEFLVERYYGLSRALTKIERSFVDGSLLEIFDPDGDLILGQYSAKRVSASSTYLEPEFDGCVSLGGSRPLILRPPPPCPAGKP